MGRGYYDSERYQTIQTITIPSLQVANQTSVIASAVTAGISTLMKNVTVKDFNVALIVGSTNTGTPTWKIALGYSSAGTGTFTAIGTATIGTAANGTVLDAAVTETNLSAGDDLVVKYLAGTALPAGVNRISHVNVSVVERFV